MTVEKLITDHIDIWSSALQARSTAGRGSNGKINLYGMKKLRELILELAVRGKLVPQDPNDEPASELLKRIAAEKAELVKQGEIKKQKPLPEISEDEKPFELPEGWEWVRLSEAFYLEMGQSPSSEHYNQLEDGIPFFQGKADFGDRYPTARYWCTLPSKLSEKDDVLLSVRAPVGPTNLSPYQCCIGRGLAAIRCLGDFSHYYLLFVFRALQPRLEALATGTTFSAISKSDIEPFLIPVPSINEQLRIVSKVDKLMFLCDQLEQQSLTSLAAHQQLVETLLATLTDSQNAEVLTENWARISQHFDTLFTTEASIDALKQTILQLAVMGKLVPQDPNGEPASELLKRIEQEKAQLVKEGKIKKQKPLPPVSDEEKPFELPQGWEWIRFSEILAELKYGTSQKCDYSTNGYPVLRIPNVVGGEISLEDMKFGKLSEHEVKELSLKKDDLIFIRSNGSLSIVGQCTLLRQSLVDHAYAGYLIRARMFCDSVCAEYISLMMKTVFIRDQIEKPIRTTTGVKNINSSELSNLKLALPPLLMQKVIVEKTDVLLSFCESLQSRLQSAQQTQLHLADALTETALN